MKLFIRIIQLIIITAFIFGWGKVFALSEEERHAILKLSMDETTKDDLYFYRGSECLEWSDSRNECMERYTCYNVRNIADEDLSHTNQVGMKCICKGFFQKVDGGYIILTRKIIESTDEWVATKESELATTAREHCLTSIQLATGKLKVGLEDNYNREDGELVNVMMKCSYPMHCPTTFLESEQTTAEEEPATREPNNEYESSNEYEPNNEYESN